MTLTATADVAADIEGYYGTSILHVGVGVVADLSANVKATAAFSLVTDTWSFGGSASLTGYVKGYAAATAWPLQGEITPGATSAPPPPWTRRAGRARRRSPWLVPSAPTSRWTAYSAVGRRSPALPGISAHGSAGPRSTSARWCESGGQRPRRGGLDGDGRSGAHASVGMAPQDAIAS